MSILKISGVIVPSEYDSAWTEDYIVKGQITPLSRVEAAVEAANPDEPLSVEINSRGGSVFAANQMLNVIQDWQAKTGQPTPVTVGALAASAGSTIAAQLGPVKAHANTMFMMHSAAGCEFGGPEAHEDAATAMRAINKGITTALVDRYDFAQEAVDEWFSEGRMGWITATEAKAAGLVSEIIGEDSEPVAFEPAEIEAITELGLGIAALLEPTEKPTPEPLNLAPLAELLSMSEAAPALDVVAAAVAYMGGEEARQSSSYDAGLAAGETKGALSAEAEWKERVETIVAEAAALKAENAKTAETAEAMATENATLKTRMAALDKGLRSRPGSEEGGDFWAVVAQKQADGMKQGPAMLAVHREFPALHAEMIVNATKQAKKEG